MQHLTTRGGATTRSRTKTHTEIQTEIHTEILSAFPTGRRPRARAGAFVLAPALLTAGITATWGQGPHAEASLSPPVQLTREQDHQRLMDLLQTGELRAGPDGDPTAPHAANFDESKVGPYRLPDPLILKNGKTVRTREAWWKLRRPEIVADFDTDVYGRVPPDVPKVTWQVVRSRHETVGGVPVMTKEVVGRVDNSSYPLVNVDIQLSLTTPDNVTGPVPMMMELGLSPESQAALRKRFTDAQWAAFQGTGPSWQSQVLGKGWGYAILLPTSVQPDNGEGLTQGVIGLTNKGQPRKPGDWGALRAWAWGASRALDYLETDRSVDARQIGIEGLSRYGKAALVAMAYEPRLAIAFVGSSGEGGAKILRRNFGEQVENLASSAEYHWMAGNFLKYAGPLTPNDLPVDSHELIALCAPRPVFISSGSQQVEGGWVDARGMFLGAVGAGPVYELLGKKDLGTTEFPALETALIEGDIAFRQHRAGHTTGPNWPTFLTFASRYLKGPTAERQPPGPAGAAGLHLNDLDYFETQGLSVLAYQNRFHEVFRDQKLGGIEIILHGERIATDGEVRLLPTPEQWDPVPTFTARRRGSVPDQLIAFSGYPDLSLGYRIEVTAEGQGFRIAVHLERPLPAALVGKAGFNLDFLPTAYFGKSYLLDDASGIFPRHPNGPMERDSAGVAQPAPLATGQQIVLAPEDPATRVSIRSDTGTLMLFDGRDRAQNGWFVVRSLIPAERTENALVWHVHPNVIPGWIRPPVVSYNQVGYTPQRSKVAVLELDPHDAPAPTARVVRLSPAGDYVEAFRGPIKQWGKWLRYEYAWFDFSQVREPGVYAIEYAGHATSPFRVAADVYQKGVWQPSLDTYLAVQMDHMKVRENYRVWHGLSHMDDARQAPVNYTHFDGYSMGASSDSPFASGEHIPGLNVGGWYDAGDYDIRTQTQSRVITDLVLARETFHLDWDETTVDEDARLVQIRRPDGIPDVLQQVKHGVLALLAQYGAFGHAIPGIIEPTLEEYTHLGDAASKTDGRIYDPRLGRLESDGIHSGVPDDRWAFTSHTTPLNYAAAAALAAASRVLRGYDDPLAARCLHTATQVWKDEHGHPPVIFRSFNTTGGELDVEEVKAAVELLIATDGEGPYRVRLKALLPTIKNNFAELGWLAARALPFMDREFKSSLAEALSQFRARAEAELAKNPFGVPISTGTWGGSSAAAGFAVGMYYLHQAFPNTIGVDATLRGFDYVLGRHPVNSVSYVSSVGTSSKLVGYGNNRADYTFIPGGMIPGVVVIQPDFPELKDSWPFLWYENEYVVDAATTFILAANAAAAVAH
jgi:endoglucanase